MNAWKKAIVSLLILASLCAPVSAMEPEVRQPEKISTGEVEPQWEQTRWYYRDLYGKRQKRLWSITEGKWLTDWIDC